MRRDRIWPCTSSATSTSATSAASCGSSPTRRGLRRLSQRDAAVDGHPLPGDVPCRIAREERRELTDVLRRLLASERHAALHDLEEDAALVERGVLRSVALDGACQSFPRTRPQEAGADRVHADIVRRVLECK